MQKMFGLCSRNVYEFKNYETIYIESVYLVAALVCHELILESLKKKRWQTYYKIKVSNMID